VRRRPCDSTTGSSRSTQWVLSVRRAPGTLLKCREGTSRNVFESDPQVCLATNFSCNQHVWPWEGRQGSRQGRRQETQEGASRQHSGRNCELFWQDFDAAFGKSVVVCIPGSKVMERGGICLRKSRRIFPSTANVSVQYCSDLFVTCQEPDREKREEDFWKQDTRRERLLRRERPLNDRSFYSSGLSTSMDLRRQRQAAVSSNLFAFYSSGTRAKVVPFYPSLFFIRAESRRSTSGSPWWCQAYLWLDLRGNPWCPPCLVREHSA
jgi:hypothetical protein